MPATNETYFHGTRADLRPGDLISVGYNSNYATAKPLSWVYFTALLESAIWGAELARGDGRERIYVVAPLGPFEDDPNLTDKKFVGNPTRSYRSQSSLQVIDEVTDWEGHEPGQLQHMRESVARLLAEGAGAEIID